MLDAKAPMISATSWLTNFSAAARAAFWLLVSSGLASSELADRPGHPQPRELSGIEAEALPQHFVGVLVEQRRRPPDGPRGLRELHPWPDHPDRPGHGVLALDQDAAGRHLRVVDDLIDGVDR